jgi:hypothetical protein
MHTLHPFTGSIFLWQDARRWKLLVGIFSSQFALTLSSHKETACLQRLTDQFQKLRHFFNKIILFEEVWVFRICSENVSFQMYEVMNHSQRGKIINFWKVLSTKFKCIDWTILLKWILNKDSLMMWAAWSSSGWTLIAEFLQHDDLRLASWRNDLTIKFKAYFQEFHS